MTLLKIADELPDRNKFLMHGALVAWKRTGYIFTAPSGTGKTTHVRLWEKYLGSDAEISNGDKPILEVKEDEIVAYGTPWAGKERLQKNTCVPVRGICFLRQSEINTIHKLSKKEALLLLLPQIHYISRRILIFISFFCCIIFSLHNKFIKLPFDINFLLLIYQSYILLPAQIYYI